MVPYVLHHGLQLDRAGVDRFGHEGDLVVNVEGAAEDGLVQVAHVEAGVDPEVLGRQERLEEG